MTLERIFETGKDQAHAFRDVEDIDRWVCSNCDQCARSFCARNSNVTIGFDEQAELCKNGKDCWGALAADAMYVTRTVYKPFAIWMGAKVEQSGLGNMAFADLPETCLHFNPLVDAQADDPKQLKMPFLT